MSLVWKQWADTELFPTLPPFSSIKSKELYKNSLLCEFKIINFLQYTYKITKYFTIPWSVVTIFSIILSVRILCNIEENVSCMKMHRAEDIDAMYRGGFCFLASILFLALIRLICLQITNVSLTISVNVPS